MADANTLTPYSTAKILFGDNVQKWLNSYDAQRVAAYALYESIYWNTPDTFVKVMRGTNEFPVYVPSARIMVNTLNRYVMRAFEWAADVALGQGSQQEEMALAFTTLFRREKFKSQFNSNKLYGLIRGDACWYISADPEKPEGSRISIQDTDPGSVFEITDELDDESVLGVEIIEQIASAKEADKTYIKRQTWLKTQSPDHPLYNEAAPVYDGEISYQLRSLEVDGWDSDAPKKYAAGEELEPTIIPGITHLPVYRWRAGTPETANPWGNSVLRGLETLLAGINQTISDEDLSLALSGLGQYVTDAGAPVDPATGAETTWGLGPGEVIEVAAGRKFERVSGITSIQPMQDHVGYLEDRLNQVHGSSDVARGMVDATVAESGIALQIRMGPLLDESEVYDNEIMDCLTQMFHDLKEWFKAYEGQDFGECEMLPVSGPKLPENQEARVKALFEGLNMQPPLFSQEYVWKELTRMGWQGLDKDNLPAEIAAELEFYSQAIDSQGARLDQEAEGVTEDLSTEEVE